MDSNIGKKLDGRYELLELVGVGGMADIYKAKDITEDKIVAVKILKNEFVGSEDFLRRFRNESKAIALLSHPNIVKIFDVGFTDKIQFIVMEFIDGITLTEYIQQQGVLKWRDAVHFTLQILKALQHAHDRGIVHRDIKSQNIMLLSDGTIKVMDFGIARFNRETDKTISEKAIGSVHYISPEQARGDVTDEKSDIYSVGVMLYEMLTGKKPFDGDSPVAIALLHMSSQAKKMSEINNSIPEGLEEITIKAMQKEPSKRYQTAGEMVKDIEEFKKNPSIVFEYKYFSTDGTTKYFDKVTPEAEKAAPKHYAEPKKAKKIEYEDEFDDDYDDDDYDSDEYDEDYDDEYDDDDVVAKRRSPLLSVLFAVAAVFIIVAAWLVYKIVTDNLSPTDSSVSTIEEIKVPNLIGMTLDEIDDEYPQLNIQAKYENSSEYPRDTVMEQKVAEGVTIKVTQQISVVVSLGTKMVEVDDYSLRPKDEVVSQLESKQGFKTEILWVEDETIPYNYVIKTDPPAHSTLEYGSNVTVFVSRGPAVTLKTVPDFTNIPIDQARINAQNSGLILTVVYEANPDVKENYVISQSIEPLEKVEANTVVEVVVSSGEAKTSINIDLSSDLSGEFIFKYLIDGVIQEELTETRDVSLSKTISWEIQGKEKKTYAISVTSTATGATGTLIEMEVDFTVNPVSKEQKTLNPTIFTDLLNSAPAETTPEETEATTEETSDTQTTAPEEA